MRGNLKTQKIFHGILKMMLGVFAIALLVNGGFVIGGMMIAAPFVAATVKAKDIGDTDSLATELNRIFGEMSKSIKESISTEYKEKGALDMASLDAKLKGLGLETDVLKEINDAIENHALEFEKAGAKEAAKSGLRGYIQKAFKQEGLKEQIEKAYSAKGGPEIDITKAVGTITTGQVTTDTGGNALLDMLNADEIMDIRLRQPFIEEFANTSNTSKPVYTYVDYIPGEGDVDFIAEGGEKSQLGLDIEVRTESPVKAAGYEILTEESVTDIPRMEANARGLLFKKYLLKRQNGILFGDGFAPNPLGITHIAALFNPATWVGDKVKSPNLHDVIIAVANQIYTTFSYTDDVEYYPNVAFVNPADFAALRVNKDANGQYLFPSFTLNNDKTIDGIRVVSKNKIPAGKILMGDFSKLNIIDYVAYSVRMGWINDQFIKNLFTMLGEGRFFVYVKNLDQRAFVYDDIANVIDGIEVVVA